MVRDREWIRTSSPPLGGNNHRIPWCRAHHTVPHTRVEGPPARLNIRNVSRRDQGNSLKMGHGSIDMGSVNSACHSGHWGRFRVGNHREYVPIKLNIRALFRLGSLLDYRKYIPNIQKIF